MRFALLIGLLLLFCLPAGASGQVIEIRTDEEDAAVTLVRTVLEDGSYTLLDRDTVLPEASRLGDVVVLDARVAVEGRIDGRVAIIGGDFFVRPGATVAGPIGVVGGGAYSSGLAEVGPIRETDLRLLIGREREPGREIVVLTRRPGPGPLRIPAPFGFALPTYDRVDGLTLRWRSALATAGDTSTVSLRGTIGYAFERRRPNGALEFRIRPAYRTLIALRASRATHTVDGWIRGDLENSLAALIGRSDARNYFESDEVGLALSRTPPPALIAGEGYIIPSALIRASRDRSVAAGDPWSLRDADTPWRPNPEIDDGTLVSLSARLDAGWRGPFSRLSGGIVGEWAPGIGGDIEFAQFRSSARWSMRAIRDHYLEINGYAQLSIGSDPAPRQRWSFVGGSGTLPTFEMGSIRGDQVLFIESMYEIPVRLLQLPVVGIPTLRFAHAAGTAWATGEPMPRLEQNLGAGVRLLAIDVMVRVDPTRDTLDPVVSIGTRLPSAALGF